MKIKNIAGFALVMCIVMSMGASASAVATEDVEDIWSAVDLNAEVGNVEQEASSIESRIDLGSMHRFKVIADDVRFRKSANINSTIIGHLQYGDLIYSYDTDDDYLVANGMEWMRFYSPEHGCFGWVAAKYVIPNY